MGYRLPSPSALLYYSWNRNYINDFNNIAQLGKNKQKEDTFIYIEGFFLYRDNAYQKTLTKLNGEYFESLNLSSYFISEKILYLNPNLTFFGKFFNVAVWNVQHFQIVYINIAHIFVIKYQINTFI